MNNIELRHLRYFIAVAEELHFGRAAEKLNISQPPLSQQIQALETQIGAVLLYRTNRSVRLTQAGEMFLKEAKSIVSKVHDVSEQAARIHRGEEGNLTIGLTSSAPFLKKISRTFQRFRMAHPHVNIRIEELNSQQQLQPLVEGTLDLGVMRNGVLPDVLQHHLLRSEPLVAVVPEQHPLTQLPPGELTLSHLADQPFVFFSKDVGTSLYDDILQRLALAGITPFITQEVGEALTIIGLISAGLGVSILPASYKRIQVDGVKYLSFKDEQVNTQVWLVSHRHRPLSAPALALAKMMIEDGE
ncbi:LysR substrate-binding domain-containing protein [Rouxiella badensis]|uniref:LysR family transcriptional regulator n=1 Tax=Rouxiella badensis TaxID=1646377 RepID=A0A1X0WH12_9GAMM|nr:LysR substrate-binding domain-containing protein [Rouxiella badensis]MCC3701905.1 LysR family transcriptional regulator [Rouxiella badensis]MCC3718062.1 LysR family transcriptional regulator [Rouxiella badensis]MCC3727170.1 LysR family transcriptional regulator [Rouxiella badensis]MCC3731546.1 LysR family transcriptional regulator [Rouxiella badensis]MCC3738481.1 LysR family transcriptional regulator [Rouxiella badensis]